MLPYYVSLLILLTFTDWIFGYLDCNVTNVYYDYHYEIFCDLCFFVYFSVLMFVLFIAGCDNGLPE